MARNVVSRVGSAVGDVLAADEHYLGAQSLTIKGVGALTAWACEVNLVEQLPNLTRQHGNLDELAVASHDLPNAFLTAVTSQRALIFSRSISGKPRGLVHEHELATITMDFVDLGDRARSRLFVFGMASGQVFAGECPINGKSQESADRFVEAWVEAENLSFN